MFAMGDQFYLSRLPLLWPDPRLWLFAFVSFASASVPSAVSRQRVDQPACAVAHDPKA